MSVAPANTSSIIVAVTGVVQDPSTYSVSGTTLTFSAAPPTGTSNISVRYLGIPASGVTTTAYRTVTDTTATAGQTTFSIPSYTVGYISVFRNGSLLAGSDYTATSGTSVVLVNAATAGDTITTESFYVSSVLNAFPTTGGTLSGQLTVNSATGQKPLIAQVNGTEVLQIDANGNVGIGTNSPTYKLDVRGNMRLGDGVTAEQDIQFVASGGNWQVGVNNSGPSSTNRFYIYQDATATYSLIVDSGNRVLAPANPAFLAYLSANTSVSSGVRAILLDAKEFDIGSNFNTANGRFTAPVAGTYQFNAIVAINTTATSIVYISAEIRKNGGRYLNGGWGSKADTTNAYANNTASFTVYLSAGDYIELGTEISASVMLLGSIVNGCKLSGFLVG
jgi:hypothetical protein